MNCLSMPSLEHIALVKIAINLWIQDDIVALMAKFNFKIPGEEKREQWQEIENKVTEEILKLPQPRTFQENILCLIRPIGIEILKFTEYHLNILGDVYVIANLSKLFWTPHGTVDKKKTAEILIKDVNLDITSRYELACIFCLEDDIPKLWSQIDEDFGDFFYDKSNGRWINQNRLVIIWTFAMKGEEDKIKYMYESRGPSYTLCQYAFESAAENGNRAGAEYFLQTLTTFEAEQSFVVATKSITDKCCLSTGKINNFPNENDLDVLLFLLLQMNEKQRTHMYEIYPDKILECFLDWPWQSHFMEMADRMWDYLDEFHYHLVLHMIVFKLLNGYKDYSYKELFGEFWQQSSVSHKKYVIDECAKEARLLLKLFIIDDEENIRRILKDATASQKKKLISGEKGHEICVDYISDLKWDLLEFFIRECVQSKNEMIKLKHDFTERVKLCCESLEKSEEWNNLLKLSDDIICEYEEGEILESDVTPAKRFCGTQCEAK